MQPFRDVSAALALVSLLAASFSGCLGIAGADETPRDLVSADKYSKLVVEVDYAIGETPRTSAIDLLRTRINERLSKPGGVQFADYEDFAPTDTVYSVEEIRALERKLRDHFPTHDTTILYILYLNGASDQDDENSRVLGVHYNPGAIAIFRNTVDNAGSIPGLGSESIEKSVLIHEFGHAIGLVNNGVPMVEPHEDLEHPKHSTNDQSVMYWAVEDAFGLESLLGTLPTQFDDEDIADLRAAGGK